MRKVFSIFLFSCWFLAGWGQTIGSKVAFDTLVIDIGEIAESVDPIFTFRFTNVGDAPLKIISWKGSGVAVAKIPVDPIQPKDDGTITVMYPSHRPGLFCKETSVTTNDPAQPEISLYIKGNVVAQTIGPRITFESETIDVGEREQGSDVRVHFKYRNTGDEDLVVDRVKGTDPMTPNWSSSPTKPGEEGVVTLIYDSNWIKPIHIYATIHSNDPLRPEVQIRLTGEIKPKNTDPMNIGAPRNEK